MNFLKKKKNVSCMSALYNIESEIKFKSVSKRTTQIVIKPLENEQIELFVEKFQKLLGVPMSKEGIVNGSELVGIFENDFLVGGFGFRSGGNFRCLKILPQSAKNYQALSTLCSLGRIGEITAFWVDKEVRAKNRLFIYYNLWRYVNKIAPEYLVAWYNANNLKLKARYRIFSASPIFKGVPAITGSFSEIEMIITRRESLSLFPIKAFAYLIILQNLKNFKNYFFNFTNKVETSIKASFFRIRSLFQPNS